MRGDGVLGISRSRERYLLEPWSTTVVIIVNGREDVKIGVKAGLTSAPIDAAWQRGQPVGGLAVTTPRLVVRRWCLTTIEDGVRSEDMTTVVVEVTTAET